MDPSVYQFVEAGLQANVVEIHPQTTDSVFGSPSLSVIDVGLQENVVGIYPETEDSVLGSLGLSVS